MRKVLVGLGLGLGGAALLVVLRAGDGEDLVVRDRAGARPSSTFGPEVTCGGDVSWPASVMADGVQGRLPEEDARTTFDELLADPALGGEAALGVFPDGVDAVRWRALAGDATHATLGLGDWTADGPTRTALVMTLEREGDRWAAVGWGNCQLTPVPEPGTSQVEVTRVVRAKGRTLTVLVNERQCTSARDPGPHLNDPAVVETVESVTITWTSEPVDGAATCQGNPSVERTVELAAPLGGRVVLDGGVYPARSVR
jgi:hypothetical protein